MEDTKVSCSSCEYYQHGSRPEHWGLCNYFSQNKDDPPANLPFWSVVNTRWGSIHPKQESNCAVYKQIDKGK